VFASWKGKLDLPPAWSSVKAGTAVNVMFDLGGNHGSDLFGEGSPSTARVDCATGASLGAGTVSDGNLKYKGHRYLWHWRTERAWKGTCRALTLDFAIGDGVAIRLLLRFS